MENRINTVQADYVVGGVAYFNRTLRAGYPDMWDSVKGRTDGAAHPDAGVWVLSRGVACSLIA